MSFDAALQHLVEVGADAGLETFGSDIDAEWVAQALERGGVARLKRRKLPPASIARVVVGMGLLRDHSISEVVHRLDLVVGNVGG
jgi:hypothetical protein